MINYQKLASLTEAESDRFRKEHPRSVALAARAHGSLVGGVPMPWMQRWASPVPPFAVRAQGAEVEDADGVVYLDLALGDTAAMAGHAPGPVVRAVSEQLARGSTTMLPSEAAALAGEELARRFGLPFWQLTLTATDANRFALRLARMVTGRSRILVHNWCYHGSVDETFATIDPSHSDGSAIRRQGNIGPAVDPAVTTRVAEINDLKGTEAALAAGDVAAILIEPALTNIGIVLPAPGYHDALRELAHSYGALLLIDETHTISVHPNGATAAWGLKPDVFIIGKAIAGGLPGAAYGMSDDLVERISKGITLDQIDTGGIGGTVSGNVLTSVAIATTLREVLVADAYPAMTAGATAWADGVEHVIQNEGLDWSVTRLGARAEYHFRKTAPANGGEAAAAVDHALERYLHLHALNRGIILTPFHNMALFSPATPPSAATLHTEMFREAIHDLKAAGVTQK